MDIVSYNMASNLWFCPSLEGKKCSLFFFFFFFLVLPETFILLNVLFATWYWCCVEWGSMIYLHKCHCLIAAKRKRKRNKLANLSPPHPPEVVVGLHRRFWSSITNVIMYNRGRQTVFSSCLNTRCFAFWAIVFLPLCSTCDNAIFVSD